MMTPIDLLIYSLAVWYLSYILVYEDGLFGVLKRLRALTTSWSPLSCIVCTAVWAAALVYGLSLVFLPAVYVLALAGGALALHGWSGWRYTP